MNKTRFYVLLSFLIGCLSVAYYIFYASVITQPAGVVYYLKPGSSKKTVIAELATLQVIKHPTLVSVLLYPQNSSKLKFGEYHFPKGATLYHIWYQVTHGKGLVKHAFTIVPGWSFKQLRQALLDNPDLQHTIEKMTTPELMFHLGSKTLDPEGLFFPETYHFSKNNPDMLILKQAFQLMQKKLNQAWQARAGNLPYRNEYDALIAASLIEKEAYKSEERPIIASVLVNRLNSNMLLQFDPTVIYGMGDQYRGKLHKQDLLIDSPYNTYMHKGLPPTPIAIPSNASIAAALNPETTEYFYFVARGDGSHQFSKSLIEHNAAVQEELSQQDVFFNQPLRYPLHFKIQFLASILQRS